MFSNVFKYVTHEIKQGKGQLFFSQRTVLLFTGCNDTIHAVQGDSKE